MNKMDYFNNMFSSEFLTSVKDVQERMPETEDATELSPKDLDTLRELNSRTSNLMSNLLSEVKKNTSGGSFIAKELHQLEIASNQSIQKLNVALHALVRKVNELRNKCSSESSIAAASLIEAQDFDKCFEDIIIQSPSTNFRSNIDTDIPDIPEAHTAQDDRMTMAGNKILNDITNTLMDSFRFCGIKLKRATLPLDQILEKFFKGQGDLEITSKENSTETVDKLLKSFHNAFQKRLLNKEEYETCVMSIQQLFHPSEGTEIDQIAKQLSAIAMFLRERTEAYAKTYAYFPDIRARRAHEVLRGKPIGTFLLREHDSSRWESTKSIGEAQNPGRKVLSFVGNAPEGTTIPVIYHYDINIDENGIYTILDKEGEFESLDDLLSRGLDLKERYPITRTQIEAAPPY